MMPIIMVSEVTVYVIILSESLFKKDNLNFFVQSQQLALKSSITAIPILEVWVEERAV